MLRTRKIILSFLLISTFFLVTFTLRALESNCALCNCNYGDEIEESQLMAGYNAPASIETKGCWQFYISGNFIYWQAREKGLDFAILTPSVDTERRIQIIDMDFEYKPGFKVGAGAHIPKDNWNIFIEYTRLHQQNSRNKSAVSDHNLYATSWLLDYDENNLSNAKSAWRLNLDIIDLELQRPYYLGTNLTCNPHIGLRGGWVNQKNNIAYTISETNNIPYSKMKCDSWVIGPRMGIDSNWLLGSGFRMFGNTAASILFQSQNTTGSIYDPDTPSDIYRNIKNNNNYLIPNLELTLGLGWGFYFGCNSSGHLDLSVGYDFQIFWHQNYMRSIIDDIYVNIDTHPGDFMLHGLTVNARIDF